jgi:uncharacterized protein (TIGR02246 family)
MRDRGSVMRRTGRVDAGIKGGDSMMASDEQTIAAVLTSYQAALGRSDADSVTRLFTTDGGLMAQESLSAIGADAVRPAYSGMLGAIALEIRFEIAEIRLLASEWAFGRTTSTGTIEIKATGARVPEANQELFIFQKVDGTWKIARYCFSTTSPARA